MLPATICVKVYCIYRRHISMQKLSISAYIIAGTRINCRRRQYVLGRQYMSPHTPQSMFLRDEVAGLL